MRKSLRLLALFTLLLTASAIPVQADYWKGEVAYYSDACFTNLIGGFTRYCDNSTTSWGQQSAYAIETPYNCDRPPIE